MLLMGLQIDSHHYADTLTIIPQKGKYFAMAYFLKKIKKRDKYFATYAGKFIFVVHIC